MKQKVSRVFGILFLILFVVYLLTTGIGDLINKEDYVSVQIEGAVPILQVKHSVDFIPTGSEYYYACIEQDSDRLYIVKAPKNWGSKNFTEEHLAKVVGGVPVNGLVKRITDRSVAGKLAGSITQLETFTPVYGANNYIDVGYKAPAIGKLVLLLLTALIAIGIYAVAFSKNKPDAERAKPILIGLLVLSLIWLVLLVKVLQ